MLITLLDVPLMGFTSVCSDKMSLILTIPRFIVKLPLVLLRRVCLQWPPTNLCSELIFNVRDQVWRNDLTWNDSSSPTVMKTNKLHHQCNIFAPHLLLRKMNWTVEPLVPYQFLHFCICNKELTRASSFMAACFISSQKKCLHKILISTWV